MWLKNNKKHNPKTLPNIFGHVPEMPVPKRVFGCVWSCHIWSNLAPEYAQTYSQNTLYCEVKI